MGKTASRLAAFAALAAAVAAGPAVTAQEKKPIPMKKEDPGGREKVTGSVEVYQDKQDMYRFKVVGGNGKAIVQSSKGYAKHEDAVEALEEVREILRTSKVHEGGKKSTERKGEKGEK